MGFEIDKIRANPHARIIIALDPRVAAGQVEQSATGPLQGTNGSTINRNSVVGFVVDKFSISGTANYNSPLESAAQESLDTKLQAAQTSLKGLLGPLADSLPNFSLKTVAQSVSIWTGSDRPSFNIPMAFIATRPGDDVRIDVRKLLRTTFPNFSNAGLATTIHPPNNYRVTTEDGSVSATGTISVQIGRWFSAPLQVMTNVDFQFSEVVTPDGYPLYAVGTVTFTPFRTISADEIESYIS